MCQIPWVWSHPTRSGIPTSRCEFLAFPPYWPVSTGGLVRRETGEES